MLIQKIKKNVCPILVVALIIGLFISGRETSAASSDFYIQDGILVKYNGKGGVVKIPNTVKEIGTDAFITSNITAVIIPKSVKKIGVNAFMSCTNLKEISIPASVTKIETRAFWNCEKLVTVKIANKKIIIENEVFANTKWVKNFKDDYVVINGNLINVWT